jgi:flagellar basal-body rod protein FlgG
MSGAVFALASGAVAHQLRLESLSNNLSNAGTVGFKMDHVAFRLPEDREPITVPGADGTNPADDTTLIPVVRTIDFSPGPYRQTGNPMDAAIRGEGFFCVAAPDGLRYTRNGSFSLGPEGILSTQSGYPVLGTGGEIAVDGSAVVIDSSGNVFVDGESAGTLRIVRFENPQSLRKTGEGLFSADEAAVEEAVEEPSVDQGVLEESNVNTVRMMTEMIEVLRGFETYQKVIHSIGEATSRTIASVGSPE